MDIGEDCNKTELKLFFVKLHAQLAELEVCHPSFYLLFLPPTDVTLLLEADTGSRDEADF